MKSGVFAGGLYVGKASKEEIEHRQKVEEVIEFLDFVKSTKRGILTGDRGGRRA